MRRLLAIALALALVLCQSGCGGGSHRSLKQIRNSGELRVAINPSGQPFAWAAANGYQGIEVSFVEDLARELGVQTVYTEVSDDTILDTVRYGDADIAIGRLSLSVSSSSLSYTLELGQESACLLALQPDRFDTVGSLEGRVVGMVENSSAAAVFQRNEGYSLEWLWYPSLDTALSGLLAGDIVAVVCTEAEAAAVLEMAGGQMSACGLTNGYRARYAAAVHSGNTDLLRLANALLEAPHRTEATGDEAEAE